MLQVENCRLYATVSAQFVLVTVSRSPSSLVHVYELTKTLTGMLRGATSLVKRRITSNHTVLEEEQNNYQLSLVK